MVMVMFGEIFQDKNKNKESLEDVFYHHVDISMCGLTLPEGAGAMTTAGDLRQSLSTKPRNADGFLLGMKDVLFKNNFSKRYLGRPGTNAFFVDQGVENDHEVVFGAWDDDETEGYYTYLTAREGFLVKLDVREDATARLMAPPVRYQLLEWKNCHWNESGTKRHGHAFPFFQTLPVREEDPSIEEILAAIRWPPGRMPRIVTGPCCMEDIPARMRAFFLRRNRAAWWAANRIATVWSRVYWDPTTEVGRRRLARRFVE